MDPGTGLALGAGANLIGGGLSFLGGSAANASNAAANLMALQFQQQQLSSQMSQFDRSMDFAREQWDQANQAMYHGIQWRVNDAIAAGVSPLVALGAPTFNPQAIQVGGTTGGGGYNPIASVNELSGVGDAMGRMGQDVSRAIAATRTPEEKALLVEQTNALARGNAKSDAEINMLNAQANYYNARASLSPSFPSVTGSPSVHTLPGQGNSEIPNAIPQADQAYARSDGRMEYQPAPGTPASQGDFWNSTANFIRNRLSGVAGGTGQTKERVDSDMKRLYPTALGYVQEGLGTYRPVYSGENFPKGFRPLPDW